MNTQTLDDKIRERLQELVAGEVPDAMAHGSHPRRHGRRLVTVLSLAFAFVATAALLAHHEHGSHRTETQRGETATSVTGTTSNPSPAAGLDSFPLAIRWGASLVPTPTGFVVWGGSRETANMGIPATEPDRALYNDGASYDATKQSWSAIPPGPLTTDLTVAGSYPSLATWSAGILIVGRGEEVAAWDSGTGRWRHLPKLSQPVEALASVGSTIVAIGPDVALKSVDATSWTDLPPRPATPEHIGLEAVTAGHTVYLIPATARYKAAAPIVAYSEPDKAWAKLPAPPIDPAVLTGGWDGKTLIVTNDAGQAARYTPATKSWSAIADLPVVMARHQQIWLDGTSANFMAFAFAGSARLVGNSWIGQASPNRAIGAVSSGGHTYVMTLGAARNSFLLGR